jgi:uncharacterized protein YbjQ (UPF0145 family)
VTQPPDEELPSAARARLADIKAHRTWGSSLEVAEFAAISRVGFEPVGQVLGAAVFNVGAPGDEECPYGLAVYRGEGTPAYRGPAGGGMRLGTGPAAAPMGAAAIGSARPLVATMYRARREAIRRMTAECAALGGLGVIGVKLTVGSFGGDEDILEFSAFGTAIRAPSGQDFTKLVAHGWVPVGLALGVAVGYRHDDWLTRGQTRWSAGNVEVEGYSYLVRQVRTDARNELELDLGRMGAEGVVVRDMETKISERRCPIVPFGRDHVVEATIVGTALAQFARLAPPPIYGVRKLDGRRPVQQPERQVAVDVDGEQAESQQREGDDPESQKASGTPDQPQG